MRLGRAEAGVAVGALPVTGATGGAVGLEGAIPSRARTHSKNGAVAAVCPWLSRYHAFSCPKQSRRSA